MIFQALLQMKLLLLWEMVIVMVNCQQDIVSSNSVCNHTRDKQIGLLLRGRPILVINHSYGYRPKWTPLSPMTIINKHLEAKILQDNKILRDINHNCGILTLTT